MMMVASVVEWTTQVRFLQGNYISAKFGKPANSGSGKAEIKLLSQYPILLKKKLRTENGLHFNIAVRRSLISVCLSLSIAVSLFVRLSVIIRWKSQIGPFSLPLI